MTSTAAGPRSTRASGGFLAGADDSHPAPPRLAALDGVRTLAVTLVLLFHVRVPGLSGGFLGVDVFFVLSGFLITTLLLRDIVATGRVDLARFWARRMSRLMPAVLLLFVVVGFWGALAAPPFRVPDLGADLLWCLLYVGNWHFIGSSSYFADDGTTSPLLHLWSLGVEEQFYLFWPVLLAGVAALLASASTGRHARRDLVGARARSTAAVMAVGAILAVASIVTMAQTFATDGPNRAYMGTDAKVFEPLLGAVFAAATLRPSVAEFVRTHAHRLMVGGTAGILLSALVLGTPEGPRPAYFLGGAVLLSLAAVALVAGATKVNPEQGLARAFTHPVVTYLGRISYGLYLWHWPWAVWLLPADGRAGFDPARALAVAALTVVCAAASYHLLEIPLRTGQMRLVPPRRVLRAGFIAMAATAFLPFLLGATPWYGGVKAAAGAQRLLLVGDSVPHQLAASFASAGERYGLTISDGANGGCSAMGILTVNADGSVYNPPTARVPGASGPVCAPVVGDQTAAVERVQPHIVLWWSRYEYADRLSDSGSPLRAGDPGFWEAQRASLDRSVDRLTAGGARLVIVEPEPPGRQVGAGCADTATCLPFLVRLRDEDQVRQEWARVLQHKASQDPRVRLIRVDDVFCRDDASPCDDRLPLDNGEGFPPAIDQPARADGSHFVPEAEARVADVALRRTLAVAG